MGFFECGRYGISGQSYGIGGVFFMSWNTQVIEDEYVKLTVDAAAWSAELKAVPKGDTVIGIDHFTVKPTETAVSEDYYAEYSTYTESRPFFGFAGGVDNTLLENTNYDIVLAYDLYKNGSVTEYNRLLGVRISTVSREESGESVIESELPIEDMNGFADYREAAVSFGVNLRQYGGGEIKVTAVITGAEKTVTVTKESMLCFRTAKVDVCLLYTSSCKKNSLGAGYLFYIARSLTTVTELELPDTAMTSSQATTQTFTSCTALENIKITGVIANTGFDLHWSTKLTIESLTSILSALSKDCLLYTSTFV